MKARLACSILLLHPLTHLLATKQYGDGTRVLANQYGESVDAKQGIAEEWIAPGFFLPEQGGTVSVEGRETVPNPFPIVPQARMTRRRGLKAPARRVALAAKSDEEKMERNARFVQAARRQQFVELE